MFPAIEKLLVLQERDEKLMQLQEELTRIPLDEQALEKKWQAASLRLEQLRTSHRQMEVDRKKMDLEASSKRDQIARYKTQQLQTRKNEEFSALGNEIVHVEKEIVVIEDREIELMERVSELDKQIAAEQAALKEQEEQMKKQRAELQARRERTEAEVARIKVLQAEGEQAVEAELEGLLTRYRRILQSKKKQAVVPITHGNCGGCHMKITAQTVVAARSKQLVSCDNCGRLVYWSE